MKETKAQIMAGVECMESEVVAPNTVKYRRENGDVVIRLHHTDIITRKANGDIILNSGGWRTVTTKARMNELLGIRAGISQAKGIWTVSYASKNYGYADGMVLHPDGTVTGAAPEGDAKARLTKDIAAYARKYVKALLAGEVPAPSAGDCFYCAMVDVKTGKPVPGTDHYVQHMKEGYFVPSLLVNAVKEFPMCLMSNSMVAELWSGKPASDWMKSILTRDATRSITRLLKREFGIAT